MKQISNREYGKFRQYRTDKPEVVDKLLIQCLLRHKVQIQGRYGERQNYKKALNKLRGYSISSQNKRDDVADAFAQLALYSESMGGAKVKVISRLFKMNCGFGIAIHLMV